jgi:hypothetical protein
MINAPGGSTFEVYNKSDGSVAVPATLLSSLAPAGTPGQSGWGDPIVLYDHLADRWLLSEFSDDSVGNFLNVYISKTETPTANPNDWYYYNFETPNFPDYPKYAVQENAYYVTTNEFPVGSPAYALDRNKMLAGLPLAPSSYVRFEAPDLAGFGFNALTPADLDGSAAPAGSPGYFMRQRDDEVHNVGSNNPTQDFLEIWTLSPDFATPVNSTFGKLADIPVAEFDSDLCGLFAFACFPQPGTTNTLDPLREVIMNRLTYRNFGSYETLLGNFVTDVNGNDLGGVRWFELRKSGSDPWALFQEGTVSPDTDSRWMGAIAMDEHGDIALGYSVSSDTTFPSLRYTGRLAADPLGTMPQGEHNLIAGLGSQTDTTRWGDYHSLSIDPVDGKTFWFTGNYVKENGDWQTRIGSFKFDKQKQVPEPSATLGLFVVGTISTVFALKRKKQ